MAIDFQVHGFNKGLNLDDDPRLITPDSVTYANDAEFISDDEGKLQSIQPMKGTTFAFEVPSYPQTDKAYRFIYSGAGSYRFGTDAFIISHNASDFANLSANIVTKFAAYGITAFVSSFPASGEPYFVTFNSNVVITDYNVPNSGDSRFYAYQDYISASGEFSTLATAWVGDNMFVFSANSNVCEIGVAKDNNGFTYTRLLRNTSFDWDATNIFDIRIEKTINGYYALYFSDYNGKPRVVYIPDVLTEDCALKFTPSDPATETSGIYSLDSLIEQTNLQLINNIGRVKTTNQLESGGGLLSGSYHYCAAFGSVSVNAFTEPSFLGSAHPIPVFKSSINSPNSYINIQGDVSGEQTSKVNQITIYNAKKNVFDTVRLFALYYADGATTAYKVGDFSITDNEFTVLHTGFENIEALAEGDLLAVQDVILKSKNLEIKKNRLNLANNEVAVSDSSFVDLTTQITADVERLPLSGVGKIGKDQSVVLNSSSCTVQTLSTTASVPVKLITTNTNYNVATGIWTVSSLEVGVYNIQVSFSLLPPTRADYDIALNVNGLNVLESQVRTNGVAKIDYYGTFNSGDQITLFIRPLTIPLTIGNELTSLNFSAYRYSSNLVDDFSDTTVGEYQEPLKCANTVGYMLNDNYAFYACYHLENGYITKPYYWKDFTFTQPTDVYGTNNVLSTSGNSAFGYFLKLRSIPLEALKALGVKTISFWRAETNPLIAATGVVLLADSGINFGIARYGTLSTLRQGDGNYGATSLFDTNSDYRKYGLFVSPDGRINKPNFGVGDSMNILGAPNVYNSNNLYVYGNLKGGYAEYSGSFNSYIPTNSPIESANYVSFNAKSGVTTGAVLPDTTATTGAALEGIAFSTTTKMNDGSAVAPSTFVNPENGLYLAQYKKTISNQYDYENAQLILTGSYIDLDGLLSGSIYEGGDGGYQIWGGDTYTQKTIVKINYFYQTIANVYYSGFITYCTQNRVNTQLFYNDYTQAANTWNLNGHKSIPEYLFPFTSQTDLVQEQFNYDKAYIQQNVLNQTTPYNIKQSVSGNLSTTIFYSQQNVVGGAIDNYRTILPADRKDLDIKNGAITSLFDVNDYMVAVQPNAVSILPYQSDVALSNTEVFIGNGGVYAQRESQVSLYGAKNKTSVKLIKNRNGNGALTWISEDFNKIMKYDTSSGIQVLSDVNKIRSYLINNLPNTLTNWETNIGYDSRKDSIYYSVDNIFSILYNQKMNAFTTFFSEIPERYFEYKDRLFIKNLNTVNPNKVYEMNTGNTLEFSPDDAEPTLGTFILEVATNKNGLSPKRYVNVGLIVGDSHVNNPTITVTNDFQTSTIIPSKLEIRHGQLVGAVKNDSLDKPIISQYVKVRLTTQLNMRILGFVNRFYVKSRTVFK